MTSNVQLEWEKVKDQISLYTYYDSPKEYHKWRRLFLKHGFIKPTGRVWGRRTKQTSTDRNAYCRGYYKKWRAENKEKLQQYQVNHWTKKIQQQVRSDHPQILSIS